MEYDSAIKAIGYMAKYPDQAPEELREYFTELFNLYSQDTELRRQYKEKEHTVEAIQEEMHKLNNELCKIMGSASTLSGIISKKLTAEQILEFSKKVDNGEEQCEKPIQKTESKSE